jgi:heptosyltransferase-2
MNLAVFMPGWIGDAVMVTPALRALRTHYRSARLVGVVKPYVAGVLEGGDWFDDVLLANDGTWSRGVAATAARLKRQRIDLAVLFPNSFRSALTAWLGRCRQRVGYARYGRWSFLTEALEPVRDSAGRLMPSPIIDAYNRLAERVGCPHPGYCMELFTTPDNERTADKVWEWAGLHRFAEVICLNPGAAFGSAKYWPAEYFAELARDLAERRGCGVLVLCGPAERELALRIAAAAAHPAVHSVGVYAALSLGLTKACVRRADLLVTTDSGPRHFAAALGRPVVTLFGPTHMAWTETHYSRAVHLQKEVDCGPCQRRTCPLDHRCMKRLLPGEVFAAAQELLQRSRLPAPSASEGAA